MITLDTTNDNNAPNTMNHEDSIVLVDSDTDTGEIYKKFYVYLKHRF